MCDFSAVITETYKWQHDFVMTEGVWNQVKLFILPGLMLALLTLLPTTYLNLCE